MLRYTYIIKLVTLASAFSLSCVTANEKLSTAETGEKSYIRAKYAISFLHGELDNEFLKTLTSRARTKMEERTSDNARTRARDVLLALFSPVIVDCAMDVKAISSSIVSAFLRLPIS